MDFGFHFALAIVIELGELLLWLIQLRKTLYIHDVAAAAVVAALGIKSFIKIYEVFFFLSHSSFLDMHITWGEVLLFINLKISIENSTANSQKLEEN